MWQALVAVYGIQRFEDGLRRAIAECSFFPKLGDIEPRIAGPSDDRGSNAKTYADPRCPVCHGEGWVIVQTGHTTGGNAISEKTGAAMRCACFRDRKAHNQPLDKGFQPYSSAEWKEAEIARRSPECLAYRNAIRKTAGKPPMTMAEHLAEVEAGKFDPAKELQVGIAGENRRKETT